MVVYDYKFPTLATKLYYHYRKNQAAGNTPANCKFNIINFVNVEYSRRVNPIQQKYISNLAAAMETAETLVESLQKDKREAAVVMTSSRSLQPTSSPLAFTSLLTTTKCLMIKMEISLMPNTSKLKEHSTNDSQVGSMQRMSGTSRQTCGASLLERAILRHASCPILPQPRLQGNL